MYYILLHKNIEILERENKKRQRNEKERVKETKKRRQKLRQRNEDREMNTKKGYKELETENRRNGYREN